MKAKKTVTHKFIAYLLSLIMLLGLTMQTNAAFDRSYTAPKGTPVIDGEIDDVWNTAEWTAVDKPFDGTADTDSVLNMKLLWDESYLYFLAYVYDTEYNRKNDIVEVYIDQNNDKQAGSYGADDTHTRFYVAGGVVQGEADVAGQNSQQDAPSATLSMGDNIYIVEGALKWPAGTPSIGDQMGLEFMYNDGGLYQAWVDAYRWNVDTANGDEPPYLGTSDFGTLILADVGTPTEANSQLPVINTNKDDANSDNTDADNKDTDNTDADNTNSDNIDTDKNADSNTDKKDSTNNTWIIILCSVLAVVVLAVVVILIARKKKKN